MARFLCRIVVVCLLVTFLGAPWAAAEPGEEYGASSPQLLDELWGWLDSLWGEAGCIIDPSGRCGEAPSPIYQEEGCIIDPDGRCGTPRPANQKEGCIIDPNGACRH
jgi:hypothetical protein